MDIEITVRTEGDFKKIKDTFASLKGSISSQINSAEYKLSILAFYIENRNNSVELTLPSNPIKIYLNGSYICFMYKDYDFRINHYNMDKVPNVRFID